jgi:ElaB/YqjD/DUF883 family membrane-anchored ribosome-binding protein
VKNCCAPRPARPATRSRKSAPRPRPPRAAKIKLAEAEAAVVDKAKQVGRAADDYVHDNPWRSVGVAAGIGFIAGLLIGRR